MDRPYDGHSRGGVRNQTSQTATGNVRRQLPEIATTNKLTLFNTPVKTPKLPDFTTQSQSTKIQIPDKKLPPRQKFDFDVNKQSTQFDLPKLTVPQKKTNLINLPKLEAPIKKTIVENKNIPTPTKQAKLPEAKTIPVKPSVSLESSVAGFGMKDFSKTRTPTTSNTQSPQKINWLEFEVNTVEPIRYSDL